MRTVQAVIERVRAEFMEMPGLRLTPEQVQRLCGVERLLCARVLDTLVETKFLCVKPSGAYARLTEGADVLRSQPKRADLRVEQRLKAS